MDKGQKTMKLQHKYTLLTQEGRLYNLERPIIALTGGIATGKSTVTKLLADKGVQIIDADQLVKSIYRTNEAKSFIQGICPDALKHNEIDFRILREKVFNDENLKSKVENFIYARLPAAFKEVSQKLENQDFYFYDVPLLFERNLDQLVDIKIVAYAPRKTQLARLLDRDGSKEEIGRKILDQQLDIEVKKNKADFIVDNSGTLTELTAEVDRLISKLFY